MEEHSKRKNIKINEGMHSSEIERGRRMQGGCRKRESEGKRGRMELESREGGMGGCRDDMVRREGLGYNEVEKQGARAQMLMT